MVKAENGELTPEEAVEQAIQLVQAELADYVIIK
jgi:hypothetical protein